MTPAEFAEAVAKIGAPLDLRITAITWKVIPDKGSVVIVRLESQSSQLALFEEI